MTGPPRRTSGGPPGGAEVGGSPRRPGCGAALGNAGEGRPDPHAGCAWALVACTVLVYPHSAKISYQRDKKIPSEVIEYTRLGVYPLDGNRERRIVLEKTCRTRPAAF